MKEGISLFELVLAVITENKMLNSNCADDI